VAQAFIDVKHCQLKKIKQKNPKYNMAATKPEVVLGAILCMCLMVLNVLLVCYASSHFLLFVCSGVVVEYRTRNREVARSNHTRSTTAT